MVIIESEKGVMSTSLLQISGEKVGKNEQQ
jgi:hypothetical protein